MKKIYQGIWNYAIQNLEQFARENYCNKDLPWCPNIFWTIQIKLCDFHNRMALPHTMPIDLPDLTSIFQRCLERQLYLLSVLPACYIVPPPSYPTPAAPPSTYQEPPTMVLTDVVF
jgi:hypothetical protein